MLDLAGTWQLQNKARNITVDYPVPGDVHSALIAAGQIPHPYKGTNEFAVRWVADEEWVATKRFNVEKIEGGEYFLDIDYLDTVADVSVNGVHVLHAENCFRCYNPDVTKALKVGENVVEVVLHSNTKAANAKQAEQPFYIPYSISNNPIPNGNMLRKPQCHFGWDWNLAVVPFGVCGRFNLWRKSSAEIEHVDVVQTHNNDGSVDVLVEVQWTSRPVGEINCYIQFDGNRQMFFNQHSGGFEPDQKKFHIVNPKLWWPAGQGDQHLYELEVMCGDQIERRKIGLRKLELITDKDETGNRFA
jgi:beta-mannosidase